MFSAFSYVVVRTVLTHGDLLSSDAGQKHEGAALALRLLTQDDHLGLGRSGKGHGSASGKEVVMAKEPGVKPGSALVHG